MRDHASDTLRAKDRTVDGRHLHEPDGFPHTMMGVLFCVTLAVPVIVGICYVVAGIGGALVGAGFFLIVGIPFLVGRMLRGTRHWRVVDELEEIEVEHAEERGDKPWESVIDRINDRWNDSPYDDTVPRTPSR
jgi:hypothetical protein